jgi:hypothetical protein
MSRVMVIYIGTYQPPAHADGSLTGSRARARRATGIWNRVIMISGAPDSDARIQCHCGSPSHLFSALICRSPELLYRPVTVTFRRPGGAGVVPFTEDVTQ